MPFGLLTGLTAALFWGTLDVITALGSRVIGSLRVTAGMQSVTAVLFVAIFLLTGATLPTDPPSFGLAALLGLIGAGAYLSYFTGLQFGPIAVVSGMVAAFGGLTVVLSVVLRGESLSPLQAVGATIATVGVLLTALAFDGGLRGDPVRRSGRRLRGRRARPVLADGDHDRRRARDDDLDPDLHDRPGRQRVDRDRGGPGPGAARGERPRPSADGRPGLVATRGSSARSSWRASSTSSGSSPSRPGSRPRRHGWSASPRRSVRRSRSSSRSRSSASGCGRSSGSGCSGILTGMVCIAIP